MSKQILEMRAAVAKMRHAIRKLEWTEAAAKAIARRGDLVI